MPLHVLRNDITKMQVDAIVNAANINLRMGGGVCGAIFNAAGAEKLQTACDGLAPIQTGEAVITKGFSLPAKYIIHTAGPVYRGDGGEEALLRACYTNALDLAHEHGCQSMAFPLISSGIFGYPKDEALSVATSAIGDWLMNNDMDVSLVVFDKAMFSLSQELLGEVKAFIDENYVDERERKYLHRLTDTDGAAPNKVAKVGALPCLEAAAPASVPIARQRNLADAVGRLDEPFSTTLLRLIDLRGKTDVEVYKRANIDRKLFSKIRTGKGYMPSKKTALALAVALELSLEETNDLLERAGFALSRSVLFDVIVEYFITREKYDIYEINNALFEYDQPILGG
ncbi:MAG: macro domain-containing protein [Betaproteobacteria bacterium]|nr:macro domain-containing protein [Betaproteobacteria bacterium]